MELRYECDIESLILDTIVKAKGHQKNASELIGISESTLCRWIQQLDLSKKVGRVRNNNGLLPTPKTLTIEINDGDISKITPCSMCGIQFEELKISNITGVNFNSGDPHNSPIAVVRDELNRKHYFALLTKSVSSI
tara:strand:+ start:1794 stop:2201 length:408 start_codon:yes stop_codon:yes gene_type:complete